MQEATNNKEAWGLVLWLAGAAFAAWNGLLTLFLVGLSNQAKEAREDIKDIADKREEHCIQRTECERTHQSLDKNIDEIKVTLLAINKRLDDMGRI